MNGPAARPALCPADSPSAAPRNTMSHLLHALNQPLTGLQCSLELATCGVRSTRQYLQTLGQALELVARMRTLVEALRELADIEPWQRQEAAVVRLDELLLETVRELAPVAEAKEIDLQVEVNQALLVRADRSQMTNLLFRGLDSAVSLAEDGSDVQVWAAAEKGQACLSVSWKPGSPPPDSPLSRAELAWLVCQTGWERLGAECVLQSDSNLQTCVVRMPSPGARDGGRGAETGSENGGKR